jgi:high-affinity iron transporter
LQWLAIAAAALGAAAIAAFVATRPDAAPASAASPTGNALEVTTHACAAGWHARRSGHPTLSIANRTGEKYDVELVGSDQRTVYGEIEVLAARTTRSLRAALPPGSYSWRCSRVDGTVSFSSVERVTGPAVTDAHPFVPVTYTEIAAATTTYRGLVGQGMTTLAHETDTLRADVVAGNLDAARHDWLVAHMQYERLGAAYGTFGDFDSAINERADGLPGGVHDPQFQGFRRLELDLWATTGAGERVAVVDRLDRSVHDLVVEFPRLQTDPNDVALRTHEILENALQFELTADTDEGSHTNLATVRANVDGTEYALSAITPLLRSRDPALLARATTGLQRLAALLDTQHVGDLWTPVQSLSRAERERIDGAVSGLLEQLSPIPDVLELPRDSDDG